MLTESSTGSVRVITDESARREGVLVAFTDREGGISKGPYATLNLTARGGDDPSAVDENRERAAAAAGFEIDSLVLARQVHGARVLAATAGDRGVIGEADVLVSRAPGSVIGILTADCVPVALAGDGIVAVAHAGWRGLVGGAIEAAVAEVGDVHRAWVGPSIHSCCYEVGPEVVAAFTERGLPVAGSGRVDPGRAAVALLEQIGIEAVDATTDCTSCDPRYFSYRRDGLTGRQGAFIGLLGDA